MRKQYLLITTLAVWLATITNAYAAETTKVYSSGTLVLIFIGFCALIVVAQLIPAITPAVEPEPLQLRTRTATSDTSGATP